MAKVGKYFFKRHLKMWGIWQYDCVKDGFASANHIKDVPTFEEAVKETYKLNGWGEPKRIVRAF